MPNPVTIIAIVYATVSAITFIAFALDKRAAIRDRRRTPESTLHTFEILGGWPGALLAISVLRHKSQKLAYLAVLTAIIILHGAGWWLAWR